MAWREHSIGLHREPEMDEDVDHSFRAEQAFQAFKSAVVKPLMALSFDAPLEARQLLSRLRDQLDACDTLIDDVEPATAVSAPTVISGAASAHTVVSKPLADDIGRNQRSRVREMLLLETLEADKRAFALSQLVHALETGGFSDTSAAVVSQLHRLKKLGIIDQPANGMYIITQEGLGHLRRLRQNFGPMLRRS